MDKLLTAIELSSMLGVHRNTVYRWKKEGLPHVIVNGRPRYWSNEVVNWINKKS